MSKRPKHEVRPTSRKGPTERKAELALILGVFLFASALRLVYLSQIRANPFFDNPIVDCETYDVMAMQIARGDWLGKGAFWQAPLYPYFLGIVYRVFGHDYLRARLLQLLLGSLSCVVIYLIARSLFSKKVATASAFLASIYSVFFFFEAELLSAALVVLLSLSLILLLLVAGQAPTNRRWLLCGVVAGFLLIANPQQSLLIPVVCLWLWLAFRRKHPPTTIVRFAGVFCLGVALPVSVVTVRNYVVEKDFVPISYNGGLNFYLGNNPDYDHTVGIRPGAEWEKLKQITRKQGITKPSQESRYFFALGMRFAREQPLGFMRLLSQKLRLFWNGNEIMRNQEIYPFRRYSSLLRVLLWKLGIAFPFGLIAPLALLGIVISLPEWKRFFLPLSFIATQMVATVLFFVVSRYRVPAIPFLIMFSVFAIQWWHRKLTQRQYRHCIYSIPLAALFFFLINHSSGPMPEDFGADAYYNLGIQQKRKGHHQEAMTQFRKALVREPGHHETCLVLGQIYLEMDSLDLALEHLRQGLEHHPESPGLHDAMGVMHQKRGEYEIAVQEYLEAIQLDPSYSDAHLGLASVYQSTGRTDEALDQYREVVQNDPQCAQAFYNMGNLYYDKGMFEEARTAYREAMRLHPDLVGELSARGDRLVADGQFAQAIEAYLLVLRLEPNQVRAQFNLGNLHFKRGEFDDAIAAYRKVLDLNPSLLEARYNLATAYFRKGLFTEARTELERVKRANPDFPGIDRALETIREH